MAYHYAINLYNGDRRRILSESIPRYSGDGYKIFDTQEARDFEYPHWHVVRYDSHTVEPLAINRAREYWTAAHMRAGYAVFHTEAAAQEALAAMPELWRINPESGKVRRVATWLALLPRDDDYAPNFDGYAPEEFPSERAARVAYPPTLFAVHPGQGNVENIYPTSRRNYERDGYWVGETEEAARAQIPVRWYYNNSARRYRRNYSRGVCESPSLFAQLRAVLRTMRTNERAPSVEVRGHGFNCMEAINNAASAVVTRRLHHDPVAQAAIVWRETIARLNALTGPGTFATCEDCSGNVTSPLSARHNGRPICTYCASNYHRCRSCQTLLDGEERFDDENGRPYCQTHWPIPNNTPTGNLLAYSTDVTRRLPVFLTATGERADPKKGLWLGWELEVHARDVESEEESGDTECNECSSCCEDGDGDACDCNDDSCDCHTERATGGKASVIRQIQERTRTWAICKEDGSLDNGIEIVSVPASLRWHQEHVKPWLEDAKRIVSAWPHNDCGMHIHVGRKQLSELTQGKMLTFMQAPENQAFLTAIAGRESGTYCVRGDKKKIPAYRREGQMGRYQGLNFSTRNKATVEFRIFRSNVAPAGFMKNLEFVHAVVSWCRFASMQEVAPGQLGIKRAARGDAPAALVAYVKRNRDQYPHLAKWCEANGYLPAPRIHPDANVPAFLIAA